MVREKLDENPYLEWYTNYTLTFTESSHSLKSEKPISRGQNIPQDQIKYQENKLTFINTSTEYPIIVSIGGRAATISPGGKEELDFKSDDEWLSFSIKPENFGEALFEKNVISKKNQTLASYERTTKGNPQKTVRVELKPSWFEKAPHSYVVNFDVQVSVH